MNQVRQLADEENTDLNHECKSYIIIDPRNGISQIILDLKKAKDVTWTAREAFLVLKQRYPVIIFS